MNCAEQFFYDHAGWSYDPKTETADEGRERCARDLARAEKAFKASPFWFEWVADEDADASFVDTWEDPEDRAKWHAEEHVAEGCVLYAPPADGHGEPEQVVSLWGIFDADASYRRVVEAELADEALERINAWKGEE